jgi:hypothetical protein
MTLEQTCARIDRIVEAKISIRKEQVSAHLPCHRRCRLLHLRLDQGVTDLPHDCGAAVFAYVVEQGLRALDLGDDVEYHSTFLGFSWSRVCLAPGLPYTLGMPKLDFIHDAVKTALTKDRWTITHDPFIIEYKELTLYADLAAERPIAAQRDGRKIAVEVKSFLGSSKIQDLKVALGQYEIYVSLLEITDPERKLYVAISEKVYEEFFALEAIQVIVNRLKVPLIVVNLETQEIVKWTS